MGSVRDARFEVAERLERQESEELDNEMSRYLFQFYSLGLKHLFYLKL